MRDAHVKGRRKAIPQHVKLQVALFAAGYDVRKVKINWNHNPPLGLREWDEAAGDFIPPQNDPDFIEILLVEQHDKRTNGPGGEKRITTAGSDRHSIDKVRRLREKPIGGDMFVATLQRRKLFEDLPAQSTKPKRKIPSRPFGQRHK